MRPYRVRIEVDESDDTPRWRLWVAARMLELALWADRKAGALEARRNRLRAEITGDEGE